MGIIRRRNRAWLGWLGLFGFAVAVHAPALRGGFAWLDHADIEGGAALAPPSRLWALFGHAFARTGFYRPLTAVSLSVDAALSGSDPRLFHLTNLALHAAVAVAVALAARWALGTRTAAALIAGALFAAHPATGMVAALISYRSEALAGALVFLALALHARAQRRRAISPWPAVALFLGGLAKETALAAGPALILLWEVWRSVSRKDAKAPRTPLRLGALARAWFLERWGTGAWNLVLEAAGLGAAVALRFLAEVPAWRASPVPLGVAEAIATRAAALAKSLLAIALPLDRSISDAFQVRSLADPQALAGAAAAAALLLAAGWLWRRGEGFALAAAGMLLVPSLNIVPLPRFWSPHYLYLPLGAFALALAAALDARPRLRWPAAGAALLLAVVTAGDAGRFASDETLFGPEVAADPDFREGHAWLGDHLRQAGDLEGAARAYQAALAPRAGVIAFADQGAVAQNLGLVRLFQGRFGEAQALFQAALEASAGDPERQRQLRHNLKVAGLVQADVPPAWPALPLDRLSGITVERARGNEPPRRAVLRRTSAAWRILSPRTGDADPDSVAMLLDALRSPKVVGTAAWPDGPDAFRIELAAPGERHQIRVARAPLGMPIPVRVDGGAALALAPEEFGTQLPDPEDFRPASLWAPPGPLTRLEVSGPRRYTLVKEGLRWIVHPAARSGAEPREIAGAIEGRQVIAHPNAARRLGLDQPLAVARACAGATCRKFVFAVRGGKSYARAAGDDPVQIRDESMRLVLRGP